MLFSSFLERISALKALPLLASASHLKMAPLERISYMEVSFYKKHNPKKAAVLILCYPKNGQTNLVLIVRNSYPGVHSSQIGFPGGKVDKDDRDLMHTAIRETEEEVGVAKNTIEIIKPLSEVYIPPSNFLVQPYVAYVKNTPLFIPDAREVKKVLEVPMSVLLDKKTLIKTKMSTSYAENLEVPAFFIQDYVVWGATAMMLSEFKDSMLLSSDGAF